MNKTIEIKDYCLKRLYIERESRSPPYITPLYSDFYNECRRNATIYSKASGRSIFPICGSVSIKISIFSDRTINLAGMIKPFLDALSGILISDDSIVGSLFISQERSSQSIDTVVITIYNGITLTIEDYKKNAARNYIVLDYTFQTIIEDNPIPYNSHKKLSRQSYATVLHEGKIYKLSFEQTFGTLFNTKRFPSSIITPKLIAVEFNTNIAKTDIDNVTIIIMSAIARKIKRIRSTQSIYIKKTSKVYQESITVHIK